MQCATDPNSPTLSARGSLCVVYDRIDSNFFYVFGIRLRESLESALHAQLALGLADLCESRAFTGMDNV